MRAGVVLAVAALASCAPQPLPVVVAAAPRGEAGFEMSLLAAHNAERARFGSPAMVWDAGLAAAARAYAGELAALGMLRHAPKAARPGQGENLWIGTRGAYPVSAMAGSWASEQRLFRPGRFPDVSRSGNWADVGHYTQMVWPTSGRLGCGLASSARWDVLVCRYAPAGNVDRVMLAPR